MSAATKTENVITLKGSVAVVSEFFYCAINSILYQRGELAACAKVAQHRPVFIFGQPNQLLFRNIIASLLLNMYLIHPPLSYVGIYQPETFKRESKYGLTVLTTSDEGLLKYLHQIMSQMETWLVEGDVQRFVVVVTGVDSGETLERWQFNVSVDDKTGTDGKKSGDENNGPVSNEGGSGSGSGSGKKMGKSVKEIHNEIQAIIRQITASVTFLPLLNEPCSFDLLVYTNTTAVVPQKWEDSDPRYIMNSQEVKLRSFTTSVHKVESMVTYKEADEWEL